MPLITLNDGKQIKYEKPVTGDKIAKDISPSLFKKSLAIKVNEELKDLGSTISKDSKIQIITICLLYTSPSPRDRISSRMPSSA